MSIATRVLEHLSNHPEKTNQELSRDLDVPEPSIRRATLTLENSGKIYNTADAPPLIWSSRSPLAWEANGN